MKSKLFLSALVALFMCNLIAAQASVEDSAKVFDSGNKRIVVTEIKEKRQVDVEVYERMEDNVYEPYEKIFEGHYRDGKSHEQRKYLMSIDIPSPLPKRKINNQPNYTPPHYAGFGIGFAGFQEKGDLDDIPFRAGSSPEITLNFYQKAIPVTRNYKWSIVTGMGMRWTRYHLKGNHYFQEIDDVTQIVTAPDDWRIKKSRLGITTINVPLLLEWKTRNSALFLSAGGVCSFKTASSSRIWYVDSNRHGINRHFKEKMDSGMTLRPLTFDVLVQVGTRDFGLYARYSPVSIFEKNKGPELYPLTVGVMFYFND